MNTQANALDSLIDLLVGLRAERGVIELEIDARLKELERKITAVETTIGLYTQATGLSERPNVPLGVMDIKGLTHMEALAKIAKANNGCVRPSDVKKLFLDAGLVKGNPRHLVPHLFTIIKNSGKYEKVAPGTFKLTVNI